MSEKILKKTAFGGFNKKSVLDYVEKLQAENFELKKSADELSACKKRAEDLSAKADKFFAELEDISKKYDELKADKEKLLTENAELLLRKEALEKNQNVIVENSGNSLIQNAMIYSDKLIATARDAADDLLNKSSDTVSASSTKVDEASEKLKTARFNLECSLNSVSEAMNNVSKTLNALLLDLKGDNNG